MYVCVLQVPMSPIILSARHQLLQVFHSATIHNV